MKVKNHKKNERFRFFHARDGGLQLKIKRIGVNRPADWRKDK